MNDFNYYAPTKVVFGKGAEQKVGNLIKRFSSIMEAAVPDAPVC